MYKRFSLSILALVVALTLGAGTALAKGGSYSFDGGTTTQRASVRAALNASAFPWGIVPQRIKIHIANDGSSASTPGEIWLGGRLLDAGSFAWGTIQHEYAHQVDFSLFHQSERALLMQKLGGISYWAAPGVPHGDLTSERFASTLAWSYWPTSENIMKPSGPRDEAGVMSPRKFRALMKTMLNVSDTLTKRPAHK